MEIILTPDELIVAVSILLTLFLILLALIFHCMGYNSCLACERKHNKNLRAQNASLIDLMEENIKLNLDAFETRKAMIHESLEIGSNGEEHSWFSDEDNRQWH